MAWSSSASANLRSMLPGNYGAVAQTIRTLGGNDVVAAEQHIDVFSGRTFRQTLACPGRPPSGPYRAT